MVEHEPKTARYERANQKLRYLLRRGVLLGNRISAENKTELAVWAPSNSGGRSGYYACFRVFHREGDVLYAILFCFYDGTGGSVSLPTEGAAKEFAISQGCAASSLQM